MRPPEVFESTQPAWEAGVGTSAGDQKGEGPELREEFLQAGAGQEEVVRAAFPSTEQSNRQMRHREGL